MAPQLTRTIGRLARGLRSWISLANTSLPAPVSPSRSTVAPVGATCSTSCIVSRAAALSAVTPLFQPELLHLAVEQLVVASQQVAQLRTPRAGRAVSCS